MSALSFLCFEVCASSSQSKATTPSLLELLSQFREIFLAFQQQWNGWTIHSTQTLQTLLNNWLNMQSQILSPSSTSSLSHQKRTDRLHHYALYAATLKSAHQSLRDLSETIQQMSLQYQTVQQHLALMKTKWLEVQQAHIKETQVSQTPSATTEHTEEAIGTTARIDMPFHSQTEASSEMSESILINQACAEEIIYDANNTLLHFSRELHAKVLLLNEMERLLHSWELPASSVGSHLSLPRSILHAAHPVEVEDGSAEILLHPTAWNTEQLEAYVTSWHLQPFIPSKETIATFLQKVDGELGIKPSLIQET